MLEPPSSSWLALPASAGAQAQDPQAQLAVAEVQWAARTPSSYVLSYSFFTAGAELGGTTTVVDGVHQDPGSGTLTVADLLAEIGAQLDSGATVESLAFLTSGVPADFNFNNSSFYSVEAFRFFDPVESPELEAAQQLWANRPSDDYTIDYRYCLGISGCHDQSLTFVDGVLTDGRDLNTDGAPFWTLDVDDLLLDMEFALAEGVFSAEASYNEYGVPTEYTIDLFEGGADDQTEFLLLDFAFLGSEVNELQATVTCLAGNGRIDVNIVNDTDAAATYTQRIGNLSPRSSVVQPDSWWRSPVTGRPDGFINVVIERDGLVVLTETVMVQCDSFEGVSDPEVKFFSWCIGGNGMIFAQMANDTGSSRAYVLDVEGIRRSTTASAWGAAFRGISGRPDGLYDVEVITGVRVVASAQIEVDCD